MIIASSAILFAEDDAPDFARAIATAERRRMSAATWLKTATRVDQAGDPIAPSTTSSAKPT